MDVNNQAKFLKNVVQPDYSQEPLNFELELEDFGSSAADESTSEYSHTDNDDTTTNYTTARTSEIFRVADPTNNSMREDTRDQLQEEEYESSQLMLLGIENDVEINMDSEEERDIVKQIKEEITNQVKGEMAGELAVYKHKREQLKTPAEGGGSELDGMDPQLKDAYLKMRKLDRILQKKSKREKEVKRDRILLQKRLREELESIRSENPDEPRDSKQNTSKFLALTLPASHNAGVVTEENSNEAPTPFPPLFQTQVLDDSMRGTSQKTQSTARSKKSESESNFDSENASKGDESSRRKTTKKKNKDFIQRNIKLASDAANPIAMTDDEKQRVETLLSDLEMLPEIIEDEQLQGEDNPYQIALGSGEGFLPTSNEMQRLTHIDSRLRVLLPEEDFSAIASVSPRSQTSHQSLHLFTRTGVDLEELGEAALRETREQQVLKQRMQDIEQELGRLTSAVELEIESPTLTEAQLEELLDQCARTMSRASEDVTSITSKSSPRLSESTATVSRAHLYENPPKLSEDVLQQLLAEARQTLGPSAPSTTRTEAHAQDLVLESITEDTIRELLKDSRATSRASLRSGLGDTDHSDVKHQFGSQSNMTDHHKELYALSRFRRHSESGPSSRPGSGREEPHDKASERRPFLPEIDPTGSMATSRPNSRTRLNNESQSRPTSSGRSSAVTVRNSFGEVRPLSRELPAAPTPSSQSPSQPSSARPRTLSPIVKNSLDS